MDQDEAAFPHVRQHDPDDAKRQVKIGCQVGDRDRHLAPSQDLQVLRLKT